MSSDAVLGFNLFMLEVIAGMIICILGVSQFNVSYENKAQSLTTFAAICASVNSTPKPFDINTVLCTNGAEIKYD